MKPRILWVVCRGREVMVDTPKFRPEAGDFKVIEHEPLMAKLELVLEQLQILGLGVSDPVFREMAQDAHDKLGQSMGVFDDVGRRIK